MNQTHRNRIETNLSAEVKRAASAVHALLGPGLSRHAYEAGLEHECRRRGLRVERGKEFPAFYKGLRLGAAFRADLLVADTVLVQVRAEPPAAALHRAELENGLRLTGKGEGVTINFQV